MTCGWMSTTSVVTVWVRGGGLKLVESPYVPAPAYLNSRTAPGLTSSCVSKPDGPTVRPAGSVTTYNRSPSGATTISRYRLPVLKYATGAPTGLRRSPVSGMRNTTPLIMVVISSELRQPGIAPDV